MWKQFYLLAVLMLNLVIAGCGTEAPQALQFETIEQVNAPGSIKQRESPEPGLLIIAHSGEIEEVKRFITDEAALTLSQLNFSTHFAIVAFRGRQPTSHKDFRVEHIARQGNEIIINAQAGQRGGDDMETSPYHLVKVRKDGKWGRTFTFKLYFDEAQQAVVSVTHFALLFYPGGVSGRKGFRISRIYRQDNQIVVHARPGSSEGFQLDLAVRPYHLIKVEKAENWRGLFTFALYLDETAPPVVTTTHHFAQAQERGLFPPGDSPATPND